ncbi:MAG TPA: hypothetical protein VEA60_13950 [Allosphingosinicella sp.]|nr:hypothetical protein [Allosphingosinicella sp.]
MTISMFVGLNRQGVAAAVAAFVSDKPDARITEEESNGFSCESDHGQTVARDGNPTVYIARVDW